MQILNKNFDLSLIHENGTTAIDFANNTSNYVELVLLIDGREVKGYCYPPYHHKPIRTMRDGSRLPLSNKGKIRAYIYNGFGEPKKSQLAYGVPPFIRLKLNEDRFKQVDFNTDNLFDRKSVQKVIFKRMSNTPTEVLEISY